MKEITNSALIEDLNALGAGSLFAGENNVLATSEDLPTLLNLTYATEAEDGAGFEWEVGGNSGATTVTNDSIAEVCPVITITGPANNPTIENVTNGTIIRYIGGVASGQTLVIDTLSQTAKLNGTNVIGNIYGDWLSLNPGQNRLLFTSTNADAEDAVAEFSEIVG